MEILAKVLHLQVVESERASLLSQVSAPVSVKEMQ